MKPPKRDPGQRQRRARILVVDDHPLVRERLADIINAEPDLTVCAEAEDRPQAMMALVNTRADAAIIDITLKDSDGLQLIRDILVRWPGLPVLVVSMHDESVYAERAIAAGALGYITKQDATRDILPALRRVLEGKIYLHERVASRIIHRMAGPGVRSGSTPPELLAARELHVFELTGQGFDISQIAKRLRISVKTVQTYRGRIREKLDLSEPNQLLQHAIAWMHRSK